MKLRIQTFKWSGPYDTDRWCCDHKDLNGLDVVESKDGCRIRPRGDEIQIVCGGLDATFDSRDEAATVVLGLVRAHRSAIAASPVPASQREFVLREVREIRIQAEALRTLCYQNQMRATMMAAVAKDMQLDVPMPDVPGSDAAKLVAEIDGFKLVADTNDGPPLFSESKLYALLGKTDARSVLALIRRVKAALDPVAGES